MVKKQPWSKRVWYIAALIAVLSFMTGHIIAMIIINVISIIIITIVSLSLKKKEANLLIRSPISPDQFQDSSIQEYVSVNGIQCHVRSKALELKNKGIKKISEIEGLDKMWHLKKLDLSHNELTSMKGLEPLLNLRELKLSYNRIQDIESISALSNLQILLLDNNQLKEFRQSDLPQGAIIRKLDISKNPIEKFDIYMVHIYKVIKFGPKEWFPKNEINRLKKQMKRMKGKASVKTYSGKESFMKFLLYFSIWAAITFVIALIINLPFWGVITSSTGLEMNYWEFLFSNGLWTFLVGGIGAVILMVLVAQGDFP